MDTRIEAQVDALRAGRAFVRLRARRIVRVHGDDAVRWLQDLLTADLEGLPTGATCRTLLLTPTGRVRADLRALRRTTEVLLVQAPDAGAPIEHLLAPYVLSSKVALEVDDRAQVVIAPDADDLGEAFSPSETGVGVDIVAPTADLADGLRAILVGRGLVDAGPEALERFRVIRGIPRMGADFDDASLPSEVGLDDAIAAGKGCFLGQESVARIRNLGHPPTVLRHVSAEAPLRPGDAVHVAGGPAGVVTSATTAGPTTVALIRVPWVHREAALQATDGRPLHPVAAVA